MPILAVEVTFDASRVRGFSVGVKSTNHHTKRAIDGQAKRAVQTGIDFRRRLRLSCDPNRQVARISEQCRDKKGAPKHEMSGLQR